MANPKPSEIYSETVESLKRIRKEAATVAKEADRLKKDLETKAAESEQDQKIKTIRAKMKKG
jgi:hypothetical protein